jgi:hypothetical protein
VTGCHLNDFVHGPSRARGAHACGCLGAYHEHDAGDVFVQDMRGSIITRCEYHCIYMHNSSRGVYTMTHVPALYKRCHT